MACPGVAMEENEKDKANLGKQPQRSSVILRAAPCWNQDEFGAKGFSRRCWSYRSTLQKGTQGRGQAVPVKDAYRGAQQSSAACVCTGEAALGFCFTFPWGLCPL